MSRKQFYFHILLLKNPRWQLRHFKFLFNGYNSVANSLLRAIVEIKIMVFYWNYQVIVIHHLTAKLASGLPVASPGFGAREHKTKRVISKSNFYWIDNHMESSVRVCADLNWHEKNKHLEVEGRHVPQCPIAGDANADCCAASDVGTAALAAATGLRCRGWTAHRGLRISNLFTASRLSAKFLSLSTLLLLLFWGFVNVHHNDVMTSVIHTGIGHRKSRRTCI